MSHLSQYVEYLLLIETPNTETHDAAPQDTIVAEGIRSQFRTRRDASKGVETIGGMLILQHFAAQDGGDTPNPRSRLCAGRG